jgi:hypothetical protein
MCSIKPWLLATNTHIKVHVSQIRTNCPGFDIQAGGTRNLGKCCMGIIIGESAYELLVARRELSCRPRA